MFQLTIGTTTSRTKVIVSEDTTPKQAMEDNDIDYSVATVHLDGAVVSTADMNKSFAELGVGESAMLIAVVKQDNA